MPLEFVPPVGWSTALRTIPPDGLPVAWAANVVFADADANAWFPAQAIRALPADGIAMMAIGPREYWGEVGFQEAILPLTVGRGLWGHTEYEGRLTPNTSLCLIDVRLASGLLLNVTVWFGTPFPDIAQQLVADGVLATLTVPSVSPV